MKQFLIIILLLLSYQLTYSQISPPGVDLYAGGTVGNAASKPFWNVSNQGGKYTLNPFEGIIGVKIESTDSSTTFLSLDYGIEAYTHLRRSDGIILHQGFVAVKSPYLIFRAGRREDIIGNQDSTLSLGGTVWSANTRPMPKLILSTPGYIDLPFTRGYVEVNGSLAHGWFEEGRYVENVYMHQKHAHLRFGGDFFLNASLGLIHFAQWGGTVPDMEPFSVDWDNYMKIFFAKSGGDDAPIEEQINRLGNHLGARNYRIDYKGEKFTVGFYYQTIFEDNSGMSKEFNVDGIKGLVIKTKDKNKLLNHIVLEYLQTTWQSGPVHDLTGPIKLTGNDDYFNHYIYKNGWSYYDMTIGTPFITSQIYNEEDVTRMTNNRVKGYHLGLGGKIQDLNYRTFFTYSVNKGTYLIPFESQKLQFSWYFETTITSLWKGVDLNIMLAADIGEMYGNNLGMLLLLRKKINPFQSRFN